MIAGKYEMLDLLGEGGMGVVYRAQDHATGRIVALKRVRPDLVSERLVRKLTLEAKLMARLEHPGIVRLYVLEMHEGQPVLVMELVEHAVKLEDMLKQGPLPLLEVLEISIQILEALEYAHEKGVLHQDLSPSNVLVGPGIRGPTGPRFRARLLDFGIAGVLSPPSDAPQTGIPWFNNDFASPEQRRGERLDARSDLYSLSLLMWRMLVQAPEIHASDLERDEVQRHPARPGVQLPPSLDALVAQGLEPERENRPPSACEMLERLRPLLDSVRVPAEASSTTGDGSRVVREPEKHVIPPGPPPGRPRVEGDEKNTRKTADLMPPISHIPVNPRPTVWRRWVTGGAGVASLILAGVLSQGAGPETMITQATVTPTETPPVMPTVTPPTPVPHTPPPLTIVVPSATPERRLKPQRTRLPPTPPPDQPSAAPILPPSVTPPLETTPAQVVKTTPIMLSVQLYREAVPEHHKVSVGEALHTGDQVYFRVSATGEGMLWLFQCGADGRLSAWDPARVKVSTQLEGIPMQKDRSLEVPDSASFKVDPEVGSESFTFIFLDSRSPQARDEVESLTQKMLETKRCGAVGNGVALRGASLVPRQPGQTRWATDLEGVLVQTVRYRHEGGPKNP